MSTAEYPDALWVPTTHYWTGRNNQALKWIILHGTAGGSSAQEVAGWFVNNNPATSVHYVIGQDSTIVQCVREEDSAWGNGVISAGHANWWNPAINPNLQTISIEHVKTDAQNNTALTPAQEAASFRLVSYLCNKWGIPRRAADANGGITGHFSVDPVNRAFCPGNYPWAALWAALANPETLCAAPLHRETEFDIIIAGVREMGACGMAGLASAASSATGRIYHPLDVYLVARAHGWCDPSGAITPRNLYNTALAMGLKVAAFRDYAEPWPDWLSWCEQQIDAGNPMCVETARGQALVDLLTGSGENANNLQYHYYGKLGRNRGGASSRVNYTLPKGWWCADGDNYAGGNNFANNFNATDTLQYYEDWRVANAQLCAGIALVGRQTTKMVWTVQSNGTGKDDQGHECGNGFITELIATGDAAHDGLLSETYLPDKTSFLPLNNGQVYTYDGAVHTGQGAQVATKLYGLYEGALKAVPAPVPVPVLTDAEKADLAAMAAIRAALIANGIS